VLLSQLDTGEAEGEYFAAPKAAAKKKCKNRVIAFASKIRMASC
jgi:hypothetical protein